MSSDDVAMRRGMWGVDDRQFRAEQKRKRKPKPKIDTSLPSEPCCGRCTFWFGDPSRTDLGSCDKLAVVIQRDYGAVESPPPRSIVSADYCRLDHHIGCASLATRRWFAACAFYEQGEP